MMSFHVARTHATIKLCVTKHAKENKLHTSNRPANKKVTETRKREETCVCGGWRGWWGWGVGEGGSWSMSVCLSVSLRDSLSVSLEEMALCLQLPSDADNLVSVCAGCRLPQSSLTPPRYWHKKKKIRAVRSKSHVWTRNVCLKKRERKLTV